MKKQRKGGSFIAAIGTAVPANRYEQQTIADFMIQYFKMNEDASRKTSLIYHKSGINNRHSVLTDFTKNERSPELFDLSGSSPTLDQRLSIYNKYAVHLASSAAKDCLTEFSSSHGKHRAPTVTHLITVSCTGMSAPGIDIQLMKELQLPADLERTSINFMGCYAFFHALKISDAICRAQKQAVVLVVAVELCSIHFQESTDAENLVVNSLFADGAGAAIMVGKKQRAKMKGNAFELIGFSGEVISEGYDMMSWNPGQHGFLMSLHSSVPQLIRDKAASMINKSFERAQISMVDVTHWAIHPGGRKILDAVQQAIGLADEDMRFSAQVLRDFGNMSSASIIFVLKSIWSSGLKWSKKECVFASGFGPGITIETAFFIPQ